MRADAQRNREALVAAAREVFREQGCDAPLDEVGRRAGVGAGTLYRHFPTRIDLVGAVYVDDLESLCDEIRQLTETLPPAEAFDAYLDLQFRNGMEKLGMQRAFKELLAGQSPVFTVCKTQLMTLVDELVDRARAAGAVRPGVDGQTVIRLVHGMVSACETLPGAWPTMLAVVRDGLKPAPARADGGDGTADGIVAVTDFASGYAATGVALLGGSED